MTDEARRPPAGDARDDEVASLLAVPALDEVTRRRLVSTAVRDAREPGRARWLGAAAAVVVLAVVAVALTRVGGDGAPQAGRSAATTRPSSPFGGGATPEAAGTAAPDADLGDVSTAAGRRGARAAAAAFDAERATGAASTQGVAPAFGAALRASPATGAAAGSTVPVAGAAAAEACLPPADGPVEIGTGRWKSRTVVVFSSAAGVVAVEPGTCLVHRL
jgi:hypothetical protein